jgi:hypothetical protein
MTDSVIRVARAPKIAARATSRLPSWRRPGARRQADDDDAGARAFTEAARL